ncbi:hypothetical protein HZB02_00090 [Candidatus Woesearchaeota archaeon]|nr:hypothetical protein [Candidatus Woesearchaeota archaeon]
MTIDKPSNQGIMVYLSQDPCLEKEAARFYDALISLQKAVGCEYKKVEENERCFDKFVGQTYLKAMTHRDDGRTVIVLGKDHHGTAGQGYFDIDPDPYQNTTGRGFGDLVRWGHLGNSIDDGILLIDFERNANPVAGVARTPQEVQQLLRWLQDYHFDPKKEVYLTESTRIYQPEYGMAIRDVGIRTLGDWVQNEFDEGRPRQKTGVKKKETATQKSKPKSEPTNSSGWSGSSGGSLRTSDLW